MSVHRSRPGYSISILLKKARRSSPSAYLWFQKSSVQMKSARRRGRISLPFSRYIYIYCVYEYAYVQSELENIYARLCRKNPQRSTIGESNKTPFGPSDEIYSPRVKQKQRRDVTEQERLDNSRMNVVSGKIAYFRSVAHGYT